MRLRWIAITFVSMGSVMAVYVVCRARGGPVDTIVGMCQRIAYGMLFAAGFWGASHVLRRWMSGESVRQTVPTIGTAPAAPLPAFAVAPAIGEGKYRVRGFDRDTHFETNEFVFADSPSNAQMKVELKGVQVAAVERTG